MRVLLFLLPFIWCVGAVPFVNRLEPFVFGLPFLMFWEVAGVFVTFFCIFITYKLDEGKTEEG